MARPLARSDQTGPHASLFCFINCNISELWGVNVALMRHVLKHSQEINEEHFLAIDLVLPLLIKMSL